MQHENVLLEDMRHVFQLQIEALNAVAGRLGDSAIQLLDRVMGLNGKLIITGVGKSGLIGQKLAATLASTGTSSFFVNGSEALHGDLGMVAANDAVLMISNSGSTPELIRMVPSLRHIGVPIFGIFGNVNTQLAKECDIAIDASVREEACHLGLAPTSSSTAALVLGDAIACTVMKHRGFTSSDFAVNHPGGTIGRRLLLRAKDIMHVGDAIPTVKPESELRDAAIELTRSPLGAVCVCNQNRQLVGLLTDGDFRRRLIDSDDISVLVKECMTPDPTCASPNDTLEHLLELMEIPGQQVYSLPIVDDARKLMGFVRMHDVLSGDQ